MKRKTIDDDGLAEATGMLIVAWAVAKTDREEAARIAKKATRVESLWFQIEAAKLFLFLGKEYRQDEIACLKKASELPVEKNP